MISSRRARRVDEPIAEVVFMSLAHKYVCKRWLN